MGYAQPTDAPVTDSYDGHANRNPPSPEPGTDYGCAYGTDLRMAESGTVTVIDHSPGGGEGRRMSVDLDDGRRVSYIHLAAIHAGLWQRVDRGQTGLVISGASGNGSDWYYGPHVHTTLWESPGLPYYASIDFEKYVGGGNPPTGEQPREDPDMSSAPNLFHLVMGDGNQAFIAQQPTTQIIISGDWKAALEKGYGIKTRQVNEHDWYAITEIWAAELQAVSPPGTKVAGLTVDDIAAGVATGQDADR